MKDIDGSTVFSVEGFPIQPGLAGTFPWLSGIARSYQQYRIKSLDFIFRSTSADSVSANTSLGSVMLCHEADANAQPPVNKQDMLTMAGVRDTKPSLSVKLSIDTHRGRTNADNVHYIRASDVPDGASTKEYDFGDFYIATQGMDANVTTIGELWVVYEIELIRPQREDPGPEVSPNCDLIILEGSEVKNDGGSNKYTFGQTKLDSTLPVRAWNGATNGGGFVDAGAYRVLGSKVYIADNMIGNDESTLLLAGPDLVRGRRYRLTYKVTDTTGGQLVTGTPAPIFGTNLLDVEWSFIGNHGTGTTSDLFFSMAWTHGDVDMNLGIPNVSNKTFRNCVHLQNDDFELASPDCAYLLVEDIDGTRALSDLNPGIFGNGQQLPRIFVGSERNVPGAYTEFVRDV